MIKTRLQNHLHCNCYVLTNYIINPTEIHFISYTTEVITALKLNDKWYIKCSGTYSQTTRKQISWFLREYFPMIDYYNIKSIAGKKAHIEYDEKNLFIKTVEV